MISPVGNLTCVFMHIVFKKLPLENFCFHKVRFFWYHQNDAFFDGLIEALYSTKCLWTIYFLSSNDLTTRIK